MRATISDWACKPDDRIPQGHDKRLVAHQRTGAQDGVAQSQLTALARVEILHLLAFELEVHQLLFAPCFAQVGRQLFVDVKVLLDRRLAARRHKQDAADPRQLEFLHHVLHHRLAADRQHLLGLTLRGRQQPRAVAGHGNNGNVNRHGQVHLFSKSIVRQRRTTRTRVDRPTLFACLREFLGNHVPHLHVRRLVGRSRRSLFGGLPGLLVALVLVEEQHQSIQELVVIGFQLAGGLERLLGRLLLRR